MGSRLLALTTVLAVLAAAPGCGGSDDPTGNNGGPPAGLAEVIGTVSGNTQTGAVDARLLQPFVVSVSDSDGNLVQGATVNWTVTSGGGTLSATSTVTAANGLAEAFLTLGSDAGGNSAIASLQDTTGAAGVTFSAEGLVPADITLSGGDGQSARFNQILAQALAVVVQASDGRSVPGVDVQWAVTVGTSTLSASITTSDASGVARVQLVLGPTAATDSVTAAAASVAGSDVRFAATATPAVLVTVTMQNTAFNAPGGGDDVTIQLGDTVRWMNLDPFNHTATSTSLPTGGSAFDSPLLGFNQTFDFVPNVRGGWTYRCEEHPTIMFGATITVQ